MKEAKAPRDITLLNGTFTEKKLSGVPSLRKFVEQVMLDNGYPVEKTCFDLCGTQDICGILERAGCPPGGGNTYSVVNGLSEDDGEFSLGGELVRDTTIDGNGQFDMSFADVQNFSVSTKTSPADSQSLFQMGSSAANGFLLRNLRESDNTDQSQITLNWNTGNEFKHSNGVNGAFYTQTGAQASDPQHNLSVVQGSDGVTFRVTKDSFNFIGMPEARAGKILFYDEFTGEATYDDLSLELEDTTNGGNLFVRLDGADFEAVVEHVEGINNVSYHFRAGHDFAQIGLKDDVSITPYLFKVETVTVPVAGTFLMLKGVPTFADNTAAAAGAPSGALWRDPNNFIKIVP